MCLMRHTLMVMYTLFRVYSMYMILKMIKMYDDQDVRWLLFNSRPLLHPTTALPPCTTLNKIGFAHITKQGQGANW